MNLQHILRLLLLGTALSLGLAGGAIAQDDISLPGIDDADAPAATTPADPATGATESGEKSLIDMIEEGGWAMYPLGFMLLALVALVVLLFLDITQKKFAPEDIVSQVHHTVESGDVDAAMELAAASPTCFGQVIHGALDYTVERGPHVLDGDTIYDLMAEGSQLFNQGRAGTINYLSIISQAAPMLGLLGTVSGMIKAFATLGSGGMGDPSKLAANISEALMTTATGLVIALPAIFFYFFFKARLGKMITNTEVQANRCLKALRRTWVAADPGAFAHPAGAVAHAHAAPHVEAHVAEPEPEPGPGPTAEEQEMQALQARMAELQSRRGE